MAMVTFIMKILAAFLLSLISIFLCSCNNKVRISDFTWERIGHNETVIRNKDGKIIVGPANIELWREKNFIVGLASVNGYVESFIIDIDNGTVKKGNNLSELLRNTPINIDIVDDFVSYGDLIGQWKKHGKLEMLQE